jgi:competence protein ComEC
MLLRYNPQIALISVGRNHYGHPSPEVLERLENLGINSLNTLRDGDVQIELRQGYLKILTSSNENFTYFN